MPTQSATVIRGKPIERIGAIVVHGIGEQRRFEHLECETRKIVDAIIAKYGHRRRDVTVTLSTGTGDAYHGNQSSWVSGSDAPLHALVHFEHKIVDVAFHEVWWADVNETLTLGKQVRFWLWGLSLPGIVTRKPSNLPGASHTRPPKRAGKLTWRNRLRLLYISILFGFSAFSVAWVNMLLKRLQFSPFISTAVVVNYLSGVKLYSQDKRAGGSPMDGPDEPPRAAIRRRMVRTMIDVAAAGYDRWYILAHSLGSVIAWNGLMETGEALPNYLDRATWESPKLKPFRATSATPINVNAMMPNRPLWLGRREIIDRDALFAAFRGVLTYGAPLERFCALWNNMVPINKKEDPFPSGAEWVNVYDPTDPVGTWISDFDPRGNPRAGHAMLTPHNFPCRSSPILLYSHIRYLNAPRLSSLRRAGHGEDFLVNQVAKWLVEDESLTKQITDAGKGVGTFWMPLAEKGAASTWPVRLRSVWQLAQWLTVGIILTGLTVLSLEYVIAPLAKMVASLIGAAWFPGWLTDGLCRGVSMARFPDWLNHTLCLWFWTLVIVSGASLVHYVGSKAEIAEFRGRVENQTGEPEWDDVPESSTRL